MKAYKKLLLPVLLSLSLFLCGCSQIAAADTENSTDTSDEIEMISDMSQQIGSEDTSVLNSTDDADEQNDGETQTQEEYQLEQLQPYIDELEKINEKFGLDLVMCLSDPEEIARAYNEFCSMSTEEFRDYIIKLCSGEITVSYDEDGNKIIHYFDEPDDIQN